MTTSCPLELWGGLECSHVRIGDDIRDQIEDGGHRARPGDLDLIAALGIKCLRYPVLWETVSKKRGERNWSWHDRQLDRLKSSGISAVAGLVHHGSGPTFCDVLDPSFATSLACYGGEVARRYPWIETFTPINEPMTTARFSGLYGHWYPHGRDEATCFRIVVAECRAIAACMKEIRRATPQAKLVQTEDIGRVYANPMLQYQADHENERRWLALDLLAGKVDHKHALHERLLAYGVDERQLAELVDDPCPPDIIGIDQYLTSDRFLDESLDRHPGVVPGGNGRHVYLDVAATRAGLPAAETGFLPRIREAWTRYGLPIALTEVHNGCTREEQLRWLMEGWSAATVARNAGIDVRAVSVWSLFGAVDWNSLLTRREHFYEPGAFDIRFDPPRPTAIASAASSLARHGRYDHPVLARSGWWRDDTIHSRMRALAVSGTRELVRLVIKCCATRRLDVVEIAPSDSEKTRDGTWAMIHGESWLEPASVSNTPSLRLTCRYAGQDESATPLVLEADRSIDQVRVVNAFLDLVIDAAPGRFRMTKRNAIWQHAFEPMDAPRRPSRTMMRLASPL